LSKSSFNKISQSNSESRDHLQTSLVYFEMLNKDIHKLR